MVKAKCIKTVDPWGDHETGLIEGEFYEVDNVSMSQSSTRIYLKDIKQGFNSVCFEFYENDKEIDIYSDARFNPYLRIFTR